MRTKLFVAVAVALGLVACKSTGPDENLPEKPQIVSDRSELTFGGAKDYAVYVGTTVKETPIFTNRGQQTLHISKVLVTGTDAALFTALLDKQAVDSKQQAFVQVEYKPTAEGKHSAQLEITSDAENTPSLIIPVHATAVPAPQAP